MPRWSRMSVAVMACVLASTTHVDVRQAAPAASVDASPFLQGIVDVATLTSVVNGHLARSRALLSEVLAVTGPRTVDNTLRPFDTMLGRTALAGATANVVSQLHPDPAMRAAAEPLVLAASALTTELSLNRDVFLALSRIPASGLPDATQYYLTSRLDAYRLAGVDRDEATRKGVEQLREELRETMLAFNRNVRDGVRRFQVDRADLDGLPADFIAAHEPDPAGRVTLTTEATDQQPVLLYAKRSDLRRRMMLESFDVAYPENMDVLRQMIASRAAIASTLGYQSWADYDTTDRMAGTARAASEFIERIVEATGRKAAEDYRLLLERKRRDEPQATVVDAWDVPYYTELVRQSGYQFDSQALRPYFPYARVRDGVFAVTSRLFGLEFVRSAETPTWHASVEVFDVTERGRPMGRVYLDMHPRAGKAGSGASTLTVRSGAAGRQLPEVVVMARVPGGQAGDPGLMTHAQVVTFFHEFGHAVHAIASGSQAWIGLTRVSERDFIEAPSQLFEEWANDPATLATFGRHYQTDAAIPAGLVEQMRRASELGRGLAARNQMVLARLSLSLHDRAVDAADPIALVREIGHRYLPGPQVERNHRAAAFTHLANPNYSSAYYTYMWSLVIAKDLFSKFDRASLLDPVKGRAYRDAILAPGGSKPAGTLVEAFLGRRSDARAWERWMNGETP